MGAPKTDDSLVDRAEKAAVAPRDQCEPFFAETAKEVLLAFARNPHLEERDLLRLLARKDLPAEVIREVAAHEEARRNYSVQLSLARHPKTPRLISLPIIKFLYLFDLVRLCQTPGVPADVKVAAEEMILKKADTIPRGERVNLARRAPGRVAASLLLTSDRELIRAALENPYLSEAHLLRVLAHENLSPVVVELIAQHEKWSRRYYLRLALIRNPLTPLHTVLTFLPDMAVSDLRDICLDQRMPEQVRHYVLAHCAMRLSKRPPGHAASE